MQIRRLTAAIGVTTNPTSYAQNAAAGIAGLGRRQTFTLLTTRDGTGRRRNYLLFPDRYDESKALSLSHALGAKLERVDPTDLRTELPATSRSGWLVADGQHEGRESQLNVDPTEAGRILEQSMPPNSWVAITLRRQIGSERDLYWAWLRHQLGQGTTHPAINSTAMVFNITAGATTDDEVRSVLSTTEAALVGLDITTHVKIAHAFTRPLAFAAGAVTSAAAAIAINTVPQVGAVLPETVTSIATTVFAVVAVVFAVLTATCWLLGIPANFGRAVSRAGVTLKWPFPTKRLTPETRTPKQASTDSDGNHHDAYAGVYPLHRNSFFNGLPVVLPVVSPRGGANSGEAEVRERSAPGETRNIIGPRIGDAAGSPFHLESKSMRFGTMVYGEPGMGKTYLLNMLFGWMAGCRAGGFTDAHPKWPNTDTAMVAFESKNFGGVRSYQQWAEAAGSDTVAVDPMDPESWAIDLGDPPGKTLSEKSTFLTDMFAYAFGDDAIGPASYDSFQKMFAVALAMCDSPYLDGAEREGVDTGASVFYFLDLLIGGRGQTMAKNVFTSFSKQVAKDAEAPSDLVEAIRQADSIMTQTDAQRTKRFEAPANKIGQIVRMEQFWSPARRHLSFDNVLAQHKAVVINLGTSANRDKLGTRQQEQLGAMLMFALKDAISRLCDDWGETKQQVAIFSDELSLLAPNSPEVMQWFRNQGRSFGVWLFLATQYPRLLDDGVKAACDTLDNLIVFYSKESSDGAVGTAPLLSAADVDPWTPADVAGLDAQRHQVAVRPTLEGRQRNTVVVELLAAADDRAGWLAEHGFGDGRSVEPDQIEKVPDEPVTVVPEVNSSSSFAVRGELGDTIENGR